MTLDSNGEVVFNKSMKTNERKPEMTTANAQIAQHLNIVESAIKEVQEWAHVLFVKFVSGRPRFVSKKVVKQENKEMETRVEKVMYCNPESLRGVLIGDTFLVGKTSLYKVMKIKNQYFVWEKNGVEYTSHPGGYCYEKYKVEVVGEYVREIQPRW